MKKSLYIPPDKKYDFPDELVTIAHRGRILVVAPMYGNWIVLDNKEQEQFFLLLCKFPLNTAMNLFDGDKNNVISVLIQLEGRQFEKHSPIKNNEFSCQINLTNKCNLLCPHCFMSAGKPLDNELTTKEIKNFLDNLSLFGISQVSFSGGEVTTRPDLSSLIDYAYKLGLKVDILTNGVGWTSEMIDNAANKISAVQISIDGYSEEENAKIRGTGSFEKALHTLDSFLKKGTSCRVAITPFPTKDLSSKSSKYVNFAKRLRAEYVSLPLRIVFTTGFMDGRSIKLTETERENYHDIMNRISTQYLGEDAKDYPFILSARKHIVMDNCGFGSLYVSSNGDVKMCNKEFVTPVANIRTHSTDELIALSRKAREYSNINNILPCKNCPVRYICGGGCRVDEFPELRNGLPKDKIPTRICTNQKEDIYDLMIRTNEQIFQ